MKPDVGQLTSVLIASAINSSSNVFSLSKPTLYWISVAHCLFEETFPPFYYIYLQRSCLRCERNKSQDSVLLLVK